MIIDHIRNHELYEGLSPMIQKALRYLAQTNFDEMEAGKYEIEGDKLFAIVQDYQTKKIEDKKWEAHKEYVDVQYIAKGKELMGWVDIEKIKSQDEYNPEKDIFFCKADGDFVTADEGVFVIFAPQDVHMPGVAIDSPDDVRKVVVKVKINY
ncbi:MAG: YhcH/YjgK/YiaL family protein [Armatimonadota bacterium]